MGKHKDLILNIKKYESDEVAEQTASSFLPSALMLSKESKKEKKKKKINDAEDWFNEVMNSQDIKVNKYSGKNDLFSEAGINYDKKKKKKKKKNKDGVDLVDYKKEFAPESALYKNLLIDQTKFVQDLQNEYNNIKSVKGTNRGVNKQISELVENITSARSLAMQLVDKQVGIKKQVADLSLKQKKEFGSGAGIGDNMSDFGSNYLKQIISSRGLLTGGGDGDVTISDYDDDEISLSLSESVDDDANSESNRYLKYENQNVSVYVVIINDDFENYEFVAKNEDGEVLSDYPLPYKTPISVNKSTNIATDSYGKKYFIIWETDNS
jgi:hypothetical protein